MTAAGAGFPIFDDAGLAARIAATEPQPKKPKLVKKVERVEVRVEVRVEGEGRRDVRRSARANKGIPPRRLGEWEPRVWGVRGCYGGR